MEKNKNIVVLFVVFIILVVALVICERGFKNEKESNNAISDEILFETNEETSGEDGVISVDMTEELLEIIEKQLFAVFQVDVNKKEDIDNISKLILASLMLDEGYSGERKLLQNDLRIIPSFSTLQLEEAFSTTVIADLGIKHESFDVYILNGTEYVDERGTNEAIIPKASNLYFIPVASKIKSYEQRDKQYIVSMNYLFPDADVGYQNYCGNIIDGINGTNTIASALDEDFNHIPAQEYLDENYESIKEKLATYNYIFEKVDGKLKLVDFFID